MAEATSHEGDIRGETNYKHWTAGGIAGFVGGVAMGLMLQTMMTPVITTAIPALYGLNGLIYGWLIHLFNSVVFGVVFAIGVTSVSSLRGYADSIVGSTGLGVGYGILVWIGAAAILMPIWLSVVGFPGAPPLPNFNPMSLVGHVVFGLVLGALFPVVWNR